MAVFKKMESKEENFSKELQTIKNKKKLIEHFLMEILELDKLNNQD